MNFGFQIGFLDFKMDFWISKWIFGFLDFKVDFWISFESVLFVILKIQLKYTHEKSMNHIPLSLDANRIQCHRHFTAMQRILRVVIHIHTHTVCCHTYACLIIHTHAHTVYCHTHASLFIDFIHIHTHTACSLSVIHYMYKQVRYCNMRDLGRMDFVPDWRSAGYKGHLLCIV